MDRCTRYLAALALLVVVSLPVALVVAATCISASHVQQIVTSSSYSHRRNR